jgi:hypothetical protein
MNKLKLLCGREDAWHWLSFAWVASLHKYKSSTLQIKRNKRIGYLSASAASFTTSLAASSTAED